VAGAETQLQGCSPWVTRSEAGTPHRDTPEFLLCNDSFIIGDVFKIYDICSIFPGFFKSCLRDLPNSKKQTNEKTDVILHVVQIKQFN